MRFVEHRSVEFRMDKGRCRLMVLLPAVQQLMEGRYIFIPKFTVMGGSLGEMHAKDHQIMDMAMKTGCPIICINDSGGARIPEEH